MYQKLNFKLRLSLELLKLWVNSEQGLPAATTEISVPILPLLPSKGNLKKSPNVSTLSVTTSNICYFNALYSHFILLHF